MKPIINQQTCIGCGQCEATCPEVFKLNDGKAQVIEGINYDDFTDPIKQAVDGCPVQAITIE